MKTSYRFVIVGIVIIFCVTSLFAQTATRDVVYLKNGSVIHGMIIETIPNVSIKIQTADGNIFVYNFSDIDKYGKELVPETEPSISSKESAEHASGPSPSFSIFGGAAFPMGDFASSDFTNGNAGYAKTGFAAGLQFVTSGEVGLLISGLYALNSTDESSGNSEKYQSIMALLGLKIGTANVSGFNFFIAPLIGADFGKLSATSTDYYNNSTTQSMSATALAYGGMIEFDLGHLALGARFLISKPNYSNSETSTINGIGYPTPISDTREQPTQLLFTYLGIVF
jgi:hypothetical protein